MNPELNVKIESALESIRPFLRADGGDVEFVELTENMDVRIRLLGNCVNCAMSRMTMKACIEDGLRNAIPSINSVVDISNQF